MARECPLIWFFWRWDFWGQNWNNGNYFNTGSSPNNGLAVARMAAHITYLSKKSLEDKFGRKLQKRDDIKFSFDADFQIESYLRHQGNALDRKSTRLNSSHT